MRRAAGSLLLGGLFGVPLLLACNVDDPGIVGLRDTGARVDATALPPSDASGTDVPTPVEGTENRSDTAFDGCLDGDDADGDSRLDCADDDCDTAPVCCVGATSAACCAADVAVLDLTLADCATACAATAFGVPALDVSGLRPTRGNADDGVVSATGLDVRRGSATLTAHVTAPDGDRALDVVAFGLVERSAAGAAMGRVLPVVAAQVNAATREVTILVGETIVARGRIAGTAEVTYQLSVSSDGTATLTGGEAVLTVSGVPIQGALDVVAFGRTEGTGPAASIQSVALAADRCDIPSALALSPLTIVDEAGAFVAGTEEHPSLAVDGAGIRYLAFDAVQRLDPTRRGVFVAVESSLDTFVVHNPRVMEEQPVLGSSLDVEEFTDPDLRLESGRWVLYVAGEANGRESIYVASTTGADLLDFGAPERIDFEEEDVSLDSPSRVAGGASRLYARLTDASGSRIVELVSRFDSTNYESSIADGICGVDDDCADPGARDTRFILSARGGSAFDADEVDGPAHAVVRGVHRLYYAGRRGTRWATGVVVSEDGQYWRRLSDTVHTTDVVLSSHDALAPLGTRSPSVLVESDAVTVVVEGYRGTRTQLLIARQPL